MRRITITFDTGKGFAVSENGKHANHLSWGEMLEQVAQLTHPRLNFERYKMLTPEQKHAYERKHNYAPEDMSQFDEQGLPL